MNVKNAAIIIALVSAAFSAHAISADPEPVPPTAVSPWIATDNNVVGNWEMGPPEGWKLRFNADHTVAAYEEGVFEHGPLTSTWRLVNNHVIISDAYVPRKPGPKIGYDNDMQVVRVKGYTVLLPNDNLEMAQKYGFGTAFCFWHYTIQYGLDAFPQVAVEIDKATYKMLRHEQSTNKHK